MNRRAHMIALAAILALLSVVHAEDAKRVLCYGDSITAGGQWVATVGAHASIETINAGRGGRRTAWAARDLAPYLERYPDLDMIIMFLGVNDLPARDKRPGDLKVAACVKHMSEAIDLAMTRFKPEDIILVAPCNVDPEAMNARNVGKGYHITPPLLAELETGYEALAGKKGVQFLSLLDVVSKGNYRDGLHPNEAGDAEIAQAVLRFLTTPQRVKHSAVKKQDKLELPNVLIIGDSISIGYTKPLKQLLRGEVNVVHNKGNAQHSGYGLAQLDNWLGRTEWDVIHFNHGLHDLKYIDEKGRNSRIKENAHMQVPLDDYQKNMEAIVTRLKKTGATLVFATTTPFPAGVNPARDPKDAEKYNAAALEIMRKYGVGVNDLYSFALPRIETLQRLKNVHFTNQGSQALAEEVARHILEAMDR